MITYEFGPYETKIFKIGTKMREALHPEVPVLIKVPHEILEKHGHSTVEARIKELLDEVVGRLRREFL